MNSTRMEVSTTVLKSLTGLNNYYQLLTTSGNNSLYICMMMCVLNSKTS